MHLDAAPHAEAASPPEAASAPVVAPDLDPARHLALTELESGLAEIRQSPAEPGMVELVVRRPATDQREVLAEGQLDPAVGLVGDAWPDGRADPDRQVTLINARVVRGGAVRPGDPVRRLTSPPPARPTG